MDAVEAQTILLIAPAGYGKTILSRQWIEHAGGAWVTVTAASADIAVLARDLAGALIEVADFDPQRVEAALSAGRTPEEKAHAVGRVILAQIKEPVAGWIVLDDYHLMLGSTVAEELIATLQRSGRFRFVVASRERPTWATARRRVYGETVEFGARRLALDDDEIAELLPAGKQSAQLKAQARGWPAALALAAYSDVDAVPGLGSLAASLYDFLAQELFASAPPAVQQALTTLAALPPVTRSEFATFLADSDVVDTALATGLAYEEGEGIEVHPLARSFLTEKLLQRSDGREAADAGLDLALAKRLYDHAFSMLAELHLGDRFEELVAASYADLQLSGRNATLNRFRQFGLARGLLTAPVLDLLEGDALYRRGELKQALARIEEAANRLEDSHPLKTEAYLAAGSAALLSQLDNRACDLFGQARGMARTSREQYSSVHGWCLAELGLEHDVDDAIAAAERLPIRQPADRVYLEIVRLIHSFLGRRGRLRSDDAEMDEVITLVPYPALRTSWANARAVSLIYQARYSDAHTLVRSALAELDAFGLSYGVRHAEWTLAAAELGLRRFARCDTRLRKIEQLPGHAEDAHTQLNVRALRSRLLLSQRRVVDGLQAVAGELPEGARRSMNGEYLATRALSLAVLGDKKEAMVAARQATDVTSWSDTRVLCEAAGTVVALENRGRRAPAVERLVALASETGVWDGVVCAIRACPDLAAALADVSRHRAELAEVLIRSNDVALAKSCGLISRATGGTGGALSRRECEIMDHVRQGRTNAQIAQSLFIARGTVKSHMDHIFDKLGARTRAGAVARYAEIENGDTDESDGS
jgi:LuxR family transcriptional regulator, maltose regulon positive regulatory protein